MYNLGVMRTQCIACIIIVAHSPVVSVIVTKAVSGSASANTRVVSRTRVALKISSSSQAVSLLVGTDRVNFVMLAGIVAGKVPPM